MGYISTASTVTISAKLTPYGRQQLLAKSNIITHFSLGDSDANYTVSNALETGEVPTIAGAMGPNGSVSNSSATNYKIRNTILVNTRGDKFKLIGPNGSRVSTTVLDNGSTIASGTSVTVTAIDRTDTASSSGNLFRSFGLPVSAAELALFTTVTDAKGGFADTGLSGLNVSQAVVFGIDNSKYGEMIDGKSLKFLLGLNGTTYDIYGTYQQSLTPAATQDTKLSESAAKASLIGNNVVFLFSDAIQTPNDDLSKSWATGYGTVKPFAVNGKERFNLTDNAAVSKVRDIPVGVAYLDKGFVVITNPTIYAAYTAATAITKTIYFNSVSTEISQDVVCVVDRGEFISSNNPTYSTGDMIRVSEVGLHDTGGNLVAIAKPDRQIVVGANQFMALSLKISV